MAEFSVSQIGKYGSRERQIATLLSEGKSREDAMRELAKFVGKKEQFTFYQNKTGRRGRPSSWDSEPKPILDQFQLFIWSFDKTIKDMVAQGWSNPESYSERKKWSSKERQWVLFRKRFARELINESFNDDNMDDPVKSFFADISEDSEIDDYEDDYKAEPVPLPDNEFDERGNLIVEYEYDDDGKVVKVTHEPPEITRSDDIDFYYKIMMRARDFVITRELGGEFLDFVSTRAITDGAKAIAHGIRVDEVVAAVTKTWPDDSKAEFARHTHEWEQHDRSINTEYYQDSRVLPNSHSYLGYVIRLADARIPIFLVGPSGCGKSFLARDLAEALEMEYGELPLTAGATPSWLVGAETISGYKTRPFVEIYEKGGVFCFEEMDAADPNMLLLVNNALANEALTNPVTGKEIAKHSNFVAVATANTWGLGANRQYTGRERLDAATLDRWRVGRVEMDYDADVEDAIVEYWKAEANKIQGAAKDGHKKKSVKKAVKAS